MADLLAAVTAGLASVLATAPRGRPAPLGPGSDPPDPPGLGSGPSETGPEVSLVAELLAQALLAGAPPARAARVVASSVGDPGGEPLAAVADALDLGVPAGQAWALLGPTPLGPIAERLARSASTGAAPAAGLQRLAARTRDRDHAAALAAARAAGVRAVIPLGVFFLPAFLLLAVVPALVSGVRGLSG
jgi:Flp pilus assembly protein TadB